MTSRALRLRRERPELFGPGAGYEPLLSTSPHALGFVRAGSVATVVTRWPGLLARSGWKDHVVTLPPGRWNDVLTGAEHAVEDGGVPLRGAARPAAGRAPGEGVVRFRVWAPSAARRASSSCSATSATRCARARAAGGSASATPGRGLGTRSRSTAASRAPILARSRSPTGPLGAPSSSTAPSCAPRTSRGRASSSRAP